MSAIHTPTGRSGRHRHRTTDEPDLQGDHDVHQADAADPSHHAAATRPRDAAPGAGRGGARADAGQHPRHRAMRPVLDERTAPDDASGAVLFHPVPPPVPGTPVPPLTERDFWRAVGGHGAGYPEAMVSLTIAQDPAADRVLSEDPFGLLVGMLLDQQFPMERAFAGPAKVLERFGTLDPRVVAEADPEAFADLCATPPAVHRYGRSMAGRIQALAAVVRDDYAGDASGHLARRGHRRRARRPAQEAARLRRAEGEDLRRAARQAARRPARRLGAGVRRLRRARVVPLGRRRRRRRVAAEGARLQEGGQGRREGRRAEVDGQRSGQSRRGCAATPGCRARPAPEPRPVCATCGAVPADDEAAALARITWARGVENGRDVWTCDTCSRRHLRSIEGKLDSAWW